MWSENKKTDYAVNILIFLVAINFLHFGQLILPFICLILFIDNKFKFKVANLKIFIVLCLFGLSFFAFANKTFYCVMGFTFPMAYYIGSNIRKPDENNIHKLIMIIAGGMICHVLLNFIYDLSLLGSEAFTSLTHYDIWLRDSIQTPIVAIEYTIPLALIYYLVLYEKDKRLKFVYLFLIALMIVYDFALGRRTPIMMLLVSLLVSFALDSFILGKKKISKTIIYLFSGLFIIFVFIVAASKFNFLGLGEFVNSFVVIKKFIWVGLDAERFEIFVNAIKIAPGHLWGKQEISSTLGILVHELWMDIFDYAGIVPYVLMLIYSIHFLSVTYRFYKNGIFSKPLKVLVLTLIICSILHMFLEPMMSNATIFLICIIIIGTVLEKGNSDVSAH